MCYHLFNTVQVPFMFICGPLLNKKFYSNMIYKLEFGDLSVDWLIRGFLFATVWPCGPFPVSNRLFTLEINLTGCEASHSLSTFSVVWECVEFYLQSAIHLCYFLFKCHIKYCCFVFFLISMTVCLASV